MTAERADGAGAQRRFDALAAAIDADPQRRANVERHKAEMAARQEAYDEATRAVVEAFRVIVERGIIGWRERYYSLMAEDERAYDAGVAALALLDGAGGRAGEGE